MVLKPNHQVRFYLHQKFQKFNLNHNLFPPVKPVPPVNPPEIPEDNKPLPPVPPTVKPEKPNVPESPKPEESLPVVPNEYDAVEGVDYFVKPNTDRTKQENWITLPTTKNQKVLDKWGSVPLPWKTDNEITHEDVRFMFDTLAGGAFTTHRNNKLNFGPKNISTNLFATGYAQWIASSWINYPYYLFTNGTFGFEIKEVDGITPDVTSPSANSTGLQKEWFNKSPNKRDLSVAENLINKQTHYVKEIFNTGMGGISGTYFNDIMSPSDTQQIFLDFLKYFFSQIRPGMSDFDKLIVAEATVLNWFQYTAGAGTSFAMHNGVCADYASYLALLLNLVGVPAIPMVSNYLKPIMSQQHEITWVYLDPNNGNDKQWYGADMTFLDTMLASDGDSQITVTASIGARNPFYSYSVQAHPANKMLFATSKSQFEWNNDTTFTYSSMWYLPWNEPYKENSLIGKASLGDYNYDSAVDQKLPNTFFITDRTKKNNLKQFDEIQNWNNSRTYSKFVFNNGYWYWLAATRSNSSEMSDGHNYLMRCKSGGTNDDIELVKIPETYQYLLNDNNKAFPILQSWNDKMIFLNRSNKELVVVPFGADGLNWDQTKTFKLDTTKNLQGIIDFSLTLDGKLKILSFTNGARYISDTLLLGADWGYLKNSSDWVETYDISIPEEANKMIFGYNATNNNLTSGDVEIAAQFFHTLGGLYKIGQNNYEVSNGDKQKYYEELETLVKQTNSKMSSEDNFALIQKMATSYQGLINKIFKTSDAKLLPTTRLNDVYYLTPESYEKYGFTAFTDFKILSRPEDMINSTSSDAIRYDVYFNQNDASDLTAFFKNAQKIVSNSYSPKFDNKNLNSPYGYYYVVAYPYQHPEQYVMSNKVQIIQTNDPGKEITSGKLTIAGKSSAKSNFDPTNPDWVNESVSLYIDWNFPWMSSFKVQYLNLDDPSRVKTIAEHSQSYYPKFIEIGPVDNSNHGVYWIEVTTSDQQKEYSPFVYLLTANDVSHFNSELWQKDILVVLNKKNK